MRVMHPKCGAWWTGAQVSHCAGCCLTFSCLSSFDRHQRTTPEGVACLPPWEVGLVAVGKPWGTLWRWPGAVDPGYLEKWSDGE